MDKVVLKGFFFIINSFEKCFVKILKNKGSNSNVVSSSKASSEYHQQPSH